jgi:hypothetical protein
MISDGHETRRDETGGGLETSRCLGDRSRDISRLKMLVSRSLETSRDRSSELWFLFFSLFSRNAFVTDYVRGLLFLFA